MVFENQRKPYVSVRLCDSILFLHTKPHNFQFQHISTTNALLKSAFFPLCILIVLFWRIFGKSKSEREGEKKKKQNRYCLSSHSCGAGNETWTLPFCLCLPLTWEDDHLLGKEIISIHVNFHFYAERQQIHFRFCGIRCFALVM